MLVSRDLDAEMAPELVVVVGHGGTVFLGVGHGGTGGIWTFGHTWVRQTEGTRMLAFRPVQLEKVWDQAPRMPGRGMAGQTPRASCWSECFSLSTSQHVKNPRPAGYACGSQERASGLNFPEGEESLEGPDLGAACPRRSFPVVQKRSAFLVSRLAASVSPLAPFCPALW